MRYFRDWLASPLHAVGIHRLGTDGPERPTMTTTARSRRGKQLRDLRRQGLCNVTSMGASDGAMKRSIEYQGRQLKRLRNNGTKRKSETFNEKPSTVEDDRDSFAAGSMVASLGEKIVSTCNTTKRRAGSAQHFCSWSTRRHCSQRGPAQAQGSVRTERSSPVNERGSASG